MRDERSMIRCVTIDGNIEYRALSDLDAIRRPGSGEDELTGRVFTSKFADAVEVMLPESITYLPHGAFRGCGNLKKVTMPNVDTIGVAAFADCAALESVESVKVLLLDDSAFAGCRSLSGLDMPVCHTAGREAFSGSGLESAYFPALQSLGTGAFMNCNALSSVDLPACKGLSESEFWDCVGLRTVELPDAVMIGTTSFHGCRSIEDILLPSARSVGTKAFEGCSGLRSIDLYSVEKIAPDAFDGCDALERRYPLSPYGPAAYRDAVLSGRLDVDAGTRLAAGNELALIGSGAAPLSRISIDGCDGGVPSECMYDEAFSLAYLRYALDPYQCDVPSDKIHFSTGPKEYGLRYDAMRVSREISQRPVPSFEDWLFEYTRSRAFPGNAARRLPSVEPVIDTSGSVSFDV